MGKISFTNMHHIDPVSEYATKIKRLTEDDQQAMGLVFASPDETASYGGRPAIKIPCFDHEGRDTGEYSLVFLDGQNPDRGRSAGRGNHLYHPRVPGMNWGVIAKDTRVPIYLVMDEFAAYAGCKAGIATIAVDAEALAESYSRMRVGLN